MRGDWTPMGPLFSLLALASVFGGIALLSYTILTERMYRFAVRKVGVSGGDSRQIPSIALRLMFPMADRVAPYFSKIRWPRYKNRTSVNLQRAGIGRIVGVNHLLAMKAFTALVVPLVLCRLFPVFLNPALFLLGGALGFLLPDRFVADLKRSREENLLAALPGTVDVLALSVRAGLEFMTALQRIVERGAPSALRDELSIVLNDIRLGTSRADALKAFAARVVIPAVSSFVSVLVQADMLGASIGPVLEQQAERMRVERFQRAEKAGARASQKILVPLVLFILPAVLIILLGPVAIQFIYGKQ